MDIKTENLMSFLTHKAERNFEKLDSISEAQPHGLSLMINLLYQNYICVLLELHIASICLSNHILERLLKSSIILKLSKDKSREDAEAIYKKYNEMALFNVITNACQLNVIDLAECNYLKYTIREILRNGFSHADSEKILQNIPSSQQVTRLSFLNADRNNIVNLDRKASLELGQSQINEFAEQAAGVYYKYLFELFHKIQERLA